MILIEASPPAEVQGVHEEVLLANGTFHPEEIYGPFPDGVPARADSSLARAERKRGISVPRLPCPSLVMCGDEFREERGPPIRQTLRFRAGGFPRRGNHWGLVPDPWVRRAIAQYLGVDARIP